MTITLKKPTVAILLSFISLLATAQNPAGKYEVGLSISSFVYQGDLTPQRLGSYETLRFGINLHGSIIMNRSLSFRTNLAIGSLRGNDRKYDNIEYRKQRSFNFSTPIIELSELIVWDLLGKSFADKGLSAYVFAGGGVSFLKIKRDWSNFNPEYFSGEFNLTDRLAADAAHSLPAVIPVIPLGAGVRFRLTQQLAMSVESSYRLIFTDYLDGFSEAANPELNDHFQTISVGLSYKIGKTDNLDCPTVRY